MHQEKIINIYVPNIRAPKYMKETLTQFKREMHNSTITVGDFTIMNKIMRQKLNKPIEPNKHTEYST